MDMFPDILDVGNIGVLAISEEEAERRVDKMIEDLHVFYGHQLPARVIADYMTRFDIDYIFLPEYLKNKIDDAFDCF